LLPLAVHPKSKLQNAKMGSCNKCVPLADVMMGIKLGLHVGDYEPTTSFFINDRSGLFDTNSFKAQNTVLYKVESKITYLHTKFKIFFTNNKYIPPT
jgi:hypothetical protein